MTYTPQEIRNWHRSILVLFMFMGAGWASLLTRMPLVKDHLGVTAAELGFILVWSGVGSLVGLNLIGRLIAKFGSKLWIKIMYPGAALLIALSATAIELRQPVALAIVAFFMGASFGMVDVPINVDGTELEKVTGRNLMPRMHASYSFGTLLGSAWGSLAAAINIGVGATVAPLLLVEFAIPFFLLRYLPNNIGKEAEHHHTKTVGHWFSPVLILFGLGILGITLAEGGAGDWMTLGFTQGYEATPAKAGIGFMIFFAGMVVVRFFGGNLADRIGKGRTLQLLAAVGVIGILLTILSPHNLALGWLGAALWGAGVALGFPLFISAAGEGENSARRVSFVASWGYGAFLAGPPVLGLIANQTGMLRMFYVMAAFMLVALLAASAVRNK